MPTRISDLPEYTTITGSAFMPIVDVNELVASKNKKIRIDDLRKYFFTGTTTSSSFTEHTPGLYYFGDNSDGPLNLTGSITNVRTFISRSFRSTQDGPPVVKNFSSLFISRSVVVSPTNRCRGMLIFVDGDATISGSLRMTGRGASAVGTDASFTTINPPYLGDYWSSQLFPSASYLSRVFAAGAAAGATVGPTSSTSFAGNPGLAGVFGRSGGGGSGTAFPLGGVSSVGSAGTSFSGGSGGGGSHPANGSISAAANGGAGGNGSGSGGGGAGNPNGTGGTAVGEGTGGLLILIVRGNLRIGPNGSIAVNGITGNTAPGPSGGGGGGSGGGILYIYYGGTLTNNGTVTSNGGSGGSAIAVTSGAGGAGTAIISKLNTAFPVAN